MGAPIRTAQRATTQAQRAVLDLRRLILGGELAAGDRLFEVELAERLGLSRTPLREALGLLQYEGLLDRRKGGGFSVRAFVFADVTDAIEMRGVIEGTIARLAAERGVAPEALEAMRDAVGALDTVVDGDADRVDFTRYSDLNDTFHDALADMAASSVLRRQLDHVTRLPFASPGDFLSVQADDPAFLRSLFISQSQHRAVLEAIEAREGARAEAIMREHARQARRNFEFALNGNRALLQRLPGMALVSEHTFPGGET